MQPFIVSGYGPDFFPDIIHGRLTGWLGSQKDPGGTAGAINFRLWYAGVTWGQLNFCVSQSLQAMAKKHIHFLVMDIDQEAWNRPHHVSWRLSVGWRVCVSTVTDPGNGSCVVFSPPSHPTEKCRWYPSSSTGPGSPLHTPLGLPKFPVVGGTFEVFLGYCLHYSSIQALIL